MKLLFVGALSLIAGIILGRLIQPASQTGTSVHPADPASATTAQAPTVPSIATAAASSSAVESTSPAALRNQRLDALHWLTDAGYRTYVNAFSGSKVNPTLIQLLDLGADETARLTAAHVRAKQEIDSTRTVGAKSSLSADGNQLVVDVPALDPAVSGQIYDRFLAEMEATIGPERLALLRQLSGESVERDMDRFGLNGVHYEINLRATAQYQNEGIFDFKRSYGDAMGIESGSSTGRLSMAQLREIHPELARFLPPAP